MSWRTKIPLSFPTFLKGGDCRDLFNGDRGSSGLIVLVNGTIGRKTGFLQFYGSDRSLSDRQYSTQPSDNP